MYITREQFDLLKDVRNKLYEYNEEYLVNELDDMLNAIIEKQKEKNKYNNIRNKKLRGTYKGDE